MNAQVRGRDFPSSDLHEFIVHVCHVAEPLSMSSTAALLQALRSAAQKADQLGALGWDHGRPDDALPQRVGWDPAFSDVSGLRLR